MKNVEEFISSALAVGVPISMQQDAIQYAKNVLDYLKQEGDEELTQLTAEEWTCALRAIKFIGPGRMKFRPLTPAEYADCRVIQTVVDMELFATLNPHIPEDMHRPAAIMEFAEELAHIINEGIDSFPSMDFVPYLLCQTDYSGEDPDQFTLTLFYNLEPK